MARRSVSCIVVVEIDRPVGIFTERDVVRHTAKGVDLNALPMASVMSPSVVSASATAAPLETGSLMLKKSVRRLLVVDECGCMTGMLAQTDIGRVLDHQPAGLVSHLLGDPGS